MAESVPSELERFDAVETERSAEELTELFNSVFNEARIELELHGERVSGMFVLFSSGSSFVVRPVGMTLDHFGKMLEALTNKVVAEKLEIHMRDMAAQLRAKGIVLP